MRLVALAGAVLVTACAGAAPEPETRACVVAARSAPRPTPTGRAQEPTAREPAKRLEPTAARVPRTPGRFEPGQAGLAIPVPRGWRTRHREGALIYEGPMRVPSVAVFEPSRRTIEEVAGAMPDELRAVLAGARVAGTPTKTTFAGYPAYLVEGTGRAEGFPMRWRATVVEGERLAVLLALTPSFFWAGKQGAIRSFERGVRRAPLETASLDRTEAALR